MENISKMLNNWKRVKTHELSPEGGDMGENFTQCFNKDKPRSCTKSQWEHFQETRGDLFFCNMQLFSSLLWTLRQAQQHLRAWQHLRGRSLKRTSKPSRVLKPLLPPSHAASWCERKRERMGGGGWGEREGKMGRERGSNREWDRPN